MRKYCFVLCAIIAFQPSPAQLRSTPICTTFNVDVLEGSVNKMYPESALGEIMTRLPCFTEVIDEPSASGCAGVFFKDKGISFFTYRDYIEITEGFKGTMSIPLLGANRNSLFKWLGLPQARDNSWESYQMHHGILVVFFDNAGKINKLILSSKGSATLRLCE